MNQDFRLIVGFSKHVYLAMVAATNNGLPCFTICNASSKQAPPLWRDTKPANEGHAVYGVDIKVTVGEIVDDQVSMFRADRNISAACK